jgi:uncharacterized protein
MNEKERYERVDMPFYREVISPLLPDNILDFHVHSWKKDQWITRKDLEDSPIQNSDNLGVFPTAKYMVTEVEYGVERLMEDANNIFPLQRYHVVFFGQPTPSADMERTNQYIAGNSHRENMFPLLVAGKDLVPREQLKQKIMDYGLFGYKVYLNWVGNDYGNIRVEDMIGPSEMGLANEFGLVVLLHVPRSGRLADPEVAKGVLRLSKSYPEASIVLAHCGRCYRPAEMSAAVKTIADLENVYLDTSMVMDPTVLHILLNSINSRRILYATDFPVAAMRGRRVNVMDHWVDVVLEGYPESEYRVASNGIRATFMAYEIILAIKTAADTAGLSQEELKGIFFNNGMSLLGKVRGEKQTAKSRATGNYRNSN